MGAIQRDLRQLDAAYIASAGSSAFVFDPRLEVMQEEFEDLVERASDGQLLVEGRTFRVTGGMVAVGVDWAEPSAAQLDARVCEAIAAIGENRDQPVLLSGMMRRYAEALDEIALMAAKEPSAGPERREERVEQRVATSEPSGRPAMPNLGNHAQDTRHPAIRLTSGSGPAL